MKTIFTIGYEGATIEDFVATLQLMGVELLLDVRELPISRRKGFAKTALKDALAKAGIEYLHEKRLGSPKPIRDRLKKDWNYDLFFQEYGKHLKLHESLLETLADELDRNVALMCYERKHTECHRTAVAEVLYRITGNKPVHLGVQKREQRKAYEATCLGIGKSLSAAQ